MTLPTGVQLNTLTDHTDERGTFTELFREYWVEDFRPIQWNAVKSQQGVLRGVHAHKVHFDYLTIVKGRALFGLHDLRKDSPSFQQSVFVELCEDKTQVLIIPPGVAHGFYFIEPSIHIYAVSDYWNLDDELGCHFLQPELKLDWPNKNPLISGRDQDLPSYQELVQAFNPVNV